MRKWFLLLLALFALTTWAQDTSDFDVAEVQVTGDDDYKPKKSFGVGTIEGTLIALKDPDVNCDVTFDYTKLVVTGGDVYSDDKMGDVGEDGDEGGIKLLNDNAVHCEKSFFLNGYANKKSAQLKLNGSDSQYKMVISPRSLYIYEKKILLSTNRFVMLGGMIYVYERGNNEPIAKCNFYSNAAGLKVKTLKDHLEGTYQNLGKHIANAINKAKKPKK